jgi:LacI family transcriptional regulator
VRARLSALLDRPDSPTCILLPDDAAYFGVLDILWDMDLKVPRDISLAGYNGIRSVQSVRPRLTTVRQDSDAMGREAAKRLIDHIVHPASASCDPVLIPSEIMEGESLGRSALV